MTKEQVKALIKVADILDAKGFEDDANIIDSIIDDEVLTSRKEVPHIRPDESDVEILKNIVDSLRESMQ